MYKYKSIFNYVKSNKRERVFVHLYVGIDTQIIGLPFCYHELINGIFLERSIRFLCFFVEFSKTRDTLH